MVAALMFALLAAGQVGGQTGARDVVVTARPTEPASGWRRAEGAHVVVFSRGSEDELRRVATHLELLHGLLTRLFRHGATAEDALKARVVLVDTPAALRALKLGSARSGEGPFPASFADQRYLDFSEDGDLIVVSRGDQVVTLDTRRRREFDCDAPLASTPDADVGSNPGACGAGSHQAPLFRPWEGVLFGSYAQRFMLTYMPAAYPRWYLDGIGALFSTVVVRRDGRIDYAVAPEPYADVFRSYGNPSAADVLTGRYLDAGYNRMEWTPYHAALLTHFFLYSPLRPERGQQFARYMAAIGGGMPPARAAAVFGDMRKLETDFRIYLTQPMAYARTDTVPPPVEEPLVTQLSPGEATVLEASMTMDARLGLGVDAWLAGVEDRLGQAGSVPEATLLLAELDCREGRFDRCRAAADRLLASIPDNPRALSWKGEALLGEAVAGPGGPKPEALAAARAALARAITLDERAPGPQIAWFRSFTAAGEPAPPAAFAGLAKAVRSVPGVPEPRLLMAEELVRQGKPELAREVLSPVLYGGYDTPERAAAARLLVVGTGKGAARD